MAVIKIQRAWRAKVDARRARADATVRQVVGGGQAAVSEFLVREVMAMSEAVKRTERRVYGELLQVNARLDELARAAGEGRLERDKW